MRKLLRLGLIAAFLGGFFVSANGQGVGQLGSGQVWGNPNGSQGLAQPASLTSMLDRAFGSTNGMLLVRGASNWGAVQLGTGLAVGGGNLNLQPAAAGTIGGVNSITSLANNWIAYIDTAGLPHQSQPGFSNLSGSLGCSQTPAYTGDAAKSAGSCVTVLGNIPSGTTAAGNILHSNIAAPSTPASGKDIIWSDSTDLRFHDKNASGVIGTTVVAATASAHQFANAISAAGVISFAQPAFTDISGTIASAQVSGSYTGITGLGTLTVGSTGAGFTIALSTSTLTGQVGLTNLPTLGANTVLGSIAGGTPIALTATQLTTLCNVFSATVNGCVPNPGSATGKVLSDNGTWISVAGTGTVTSVAMTVPTGFSVGGSPITGAGTLAITLSNESANTIFAGPSSGGATTPGFRAMVTADLPAGVSQTIASGSLTLNTTSVGSAACSSAQTATATGAATTDAIEVSFNGDPTAVTGYIPLTTGMLTIIPYPTTNTVNFKVCNNTAASITPGAVTLNWRVIR